MDTKTDILKADFGISANRFIIFIGSPVYNQRIFEVYIFYKFS